MYIPLLLLQLFVAESVPQLIPSPLPHSGRRLIALSDLPKHVGDTVTVAGRITLGTSVFGPERLRVYIQDSIGAAALTGDSIPLLFAVGDSVEALGVASRSRGVPQLKVLAVTKIGNSKRVPMAASVSLANSVLESHLGRLITVTGRIVSIRRENGDDLLLITDFADSTSRVIVEAEEDIMHVAGFARFGIGDVLSATGVLTRRAGPHHGPEGYVLYIRDGRDAQALGLPLRTRRLLLFGSIAVILLICVTIAGSRIMDGARIIACCKRGRSSGRPMRWRRMRSWCSTTNGRSSTPMPLRARCSIMSRIR